MAKDNPTPKSDRPPFKRVWFWVTIAISFVLCIVGFALMISAAIGAVDDIPQQTSGGFTTIDNYYDEDEDDEDSDDDWYYDDEDEDEVPVYKIGETAEVGDLDIVVISITRNFSTGNRFDTPDDGMEYVKVNLTLSNSSRKKTVDYSPLDFELENGDGDIHNYATSLQDDHLGSGSLAAGGKKTGSLVFEVPAKDTQLTLHYDDYENGKASFKLY